MEIESCSLLLRESSRLSHWLFECVKLLPGINFNRQWGFGMVQAVAAENKLEYYPYSIFQCGPHDTRVLVLQAMDHTAIDSN